MYTIILNFYHCILSSTPRRRLESLVTRRYHYIVIRRWCTNIACTERRSKFSRIDSRIVTLYLLALRISIYCACKATISVNGISACWIAILDFTSLKFTGIISTTNGNLSNRLLIVSGNGLHNATPLNIERTMFFF